MQTAPCTWPVSYAGCEGVCEALSSLAPSGQAAFEEMATAFLWNWTGQRFGLCEYTIRPCRRTCDPTTTFWGSGPFPGPYGSAGIGVGVARPVLVGGLWFNITCGNCKNECGCGHTPTLHIPGPVNSIEEVLIDGAVLDPTAYRVDSESLLVRTDGHGWPHCQDLKAAPTEPDTWAVTYTYGVPVPVGGQIAAGLLACAMAKAACGQACELPERLIQSVSRQGVTVQAVDLMQDIDVGHTGIWLIDSWVASVSKSPKPWGVYSPDIQRNRVRRTTWQAP